MGRTWELQKAVGGIQIHNAIFIYSRITYVGAFIVGRALLTTSTSVLSHLPLTPKLLSNVSLAMLYLIILAVPIGHSEQLRGAPETHVLFVATPLCVTTLPCTFYKIVAVLAFWLSLLLFK